MIVEFVPSILASWEAQAFLFGEERSEEYPERQREKLGEASRNNLLACPCESFMPEHCAEPGMRRIFAGSEAQSLQKREGHVFSENRLIEKKNQLSLLRLKVAPESSCRERALLGEEV